MLKRSLGKNNERTVSKGELLNLETLAKSIVAGKEIFKGDLLTEDMFDFKSFRQGLQPTYQDDLVGKKALFFQDGK